MVDRPIIFSGPMVRALLDGRKTQTRRVITPKNDAARLLFFSNWTDSYILDPGNAEWRKAAHGYAMGDRLWVREGWVKDPSDDGALTYRADGEQIYDNVITRWKPSIHMPRLASRLTLLVASVRVQRLQEITYADVEAEGVHPPTGSEFTETWNSINAKRGFGWETNPWVVALSFDVKRGNIDEVPQ